jgi:DNA invertase Pin-like site-specific DNA recombinase
MPTDTDSNADTAPTGRGQRKLTPRQQRALRDKYQRGVSVPALMDEYGISRASVFRYLQSEKR